MVGVGDENRGQAVEGEFAVRFGIVDRLAVGCGQQLGMVGFGVMQGPGELAAQHALLQAHHEGAGQQALSHPLFEIARLPQLIEQPRLAEGFGIAAQFVVGATGLQCFEGRFSCQHAGLDGGVNAFDPRGIQEARVIADQCASGEDQLGE